MTGLYIVITFTYGVFNRQCSGAIAQLVRPLINTPEVPGSTLGFRDTLSVFHLPRGVLVRNPGYPRMYQCFTLGM
jgi:hypothetical protein